MPFSILFIGDPHFRVNNLIEVDLFTKLLYEVVDTHKPSFVCIGGDLLDTHEQVHITPLNRATTMINELRKRVPVYVLVGNHDAINNQIFLEDTHWMNALKNWENVTIVDRVTVLEHDSHTILFVPYVPNGRFIEALNTVQTDWKTADCIFAHQEFKGCKMGAIISETGDEWDEKFPFIVSGHIHSKQTPQSNIYYSGSSIQHAFGESEDNTIALFTFENRTRSLLEIPSQVVCKKIVRKRIDEVDTFVCPKDTEIVKLSLTGTVNEFKTFKKSEKYRKLTEQGVKISFKGIIEQVPKINREDSESNSFDTILHDLVLGTKNPELIELYEKHIRNG